LRCCSQSRLHPTAMRRPSSMSMFPHLQRSIQSDLSIIHNSETRPRAALSPRQLTQATASRKSSHRRAPCSRHSRQGLHRKRCLRNEIIRGNNVDRASNTKNLGTQQPWCGSTLPSTTSAPQIPYTCLRCSVCNVITAVECMPYCTFLQKAQGTLRQRLVCSATRDRRPVAEFWYLDPSKHRSQTPPDSS